MSLPSDACCIFSVMSRKASGRPRTPLSHVNGTVCGVQKREIPTPLPLFCSKGARKPVKDCPEGRLCPGQTLAPILPVFRPDLWPSVIKWEIHSPIRPLENPKTTWKQARKNMASCNDESVKLRLCKCETAFSFDKFVVMCLINNVLGFHYNAIF